MKTIANPAAVTVLILGLGATVPVVAAESTERTSPLDSVPACRERDAPPCVVDDGGTAARVVVIPAGPTPPQTPPATPPTTPSAGTLNATPTKPPASAPQTQGSLVVIPPTPQSPGTGATTVPNLPPADQTGDFAAGRTRSGPAAASGIPPNAAPADQTGDFSAGRARSEPGAKPTPATNTTGTGQMRAR